MQHQDGIKGWDIWEDMFEATLREHFGIRPNQASKVHPAESFSRSKQPVSPDAPRYRLAPSSGATEASTPTNGGNSGRTPPNTPTRKSRSTFTKEALIAYARAHNLKIEDLSSMNGNLWVRADDTDLDVNQTLLDWGFQYKFLKGWWRQNSR